LSCLAGLAFVTDEEPTVRASVRATTTWLLALNGQCHALSAALQSTIRRRTKSSSVTNCPFRVAGGRALASPPIRFTGGSQARPPATRLKPSWRHSLKNGIVTKEKTPRSVGWSTNAFLRLRAAFAENGDRVLAAADRPRGGQSGRENNSSRLPVCHEPNLRLASNFVVSSMIVRSGVSRVSSEGVGSEEIDSSIRLPSQWVGCFQ